MIKKATLVPDIPADVPALSAKITSQLRKAYNDLLDNIFKAIPGSDDYLGEQAVVCGAFPSAVYYRGVKIGEIEWTLSENGDDFRRNTVTSAYVFRGNEAYDKLTK